ncbi:DPH4 homolog [Styela clava]
MENYYETLHVPVFCELSEIKTGYQFLIKKLHPDKNIPNTTDFKQNRENEKYFHQVQTAWKILSDKQLKKDYDTLLKRTKLENELLVNEEISLSDMDIITDDAKDMEYIYPCRCGTEYILDKKYLEMDLTNIILTCETCSLHIKVVMKQES